MRLTELTEVKSFRVKAARSWGIWHWGYASETLSRAEAGGGKGTAV